MSVLISESDLATDLSVEQAVEAAYATELAEVASKLQRGLPTMIECDKDLAPYLYVNLRNRFRNVRDAAGRPMRTIYLDGRPPPGEQPNPMQTGLIGTMIAQLRDAVRGAVEHRVIVLPHLDLLTTSQGGLTAEAREVIPLLYENPELVWLGFKDPSFPVPRVIENLFPHRTSLLGIPRPRLRHLVTQKEARKFGKQFNPWALYKYVSGVNAVRLRRLLSTLEGEDYPADPRRAVRQLRQATLTGALEVPEIDFDRDIGGYDTVKKQLRSEILDVMGKKEQLADADEIGRIEELIPKGMIFWGPPGTGKTFFAKAMAATLGAAITVVSGPELKSKWVGESEENLRQIFHKARQSAPSIIVFDELDSFASARGTYTGSGVEHSMVNQLLTEMDGFHKEEMVFIIGTTNFVEILDPALLRPGRFEFHLHIPYPNAEDRREIVKIYDGKMRLKMSEDALDYAVRRTGRGYATPTGTPFSGDHLQAMCRAVARLRLRESRTDATTPDDVERGLTEYEEKLVLTPQEEKLVSTHEAGHAVCALFCPLYPPIERITIKSEMSWAAGYVSYQEKDGNDLGMTREEMVEHLCVLLGGIEAERLLLNDVSTGAGGSDLVRATATARGMVEYYGMGADTGLRQYSFVHEGQLIRDREMSEEQRGNLDRQVNSILREAQDRATKILKENARVLTTLRDLLLEQKTLDAKALRATLGEQAEKKNARVRPESRRAKAEK